MSLFRVGAQAADGTGLVSVPFMLPTLCAGFPSPAEDFIGGALELPRWLVPNPPATFIWRVRGWCMKGAGIHDGDLAVVDHSLSPASGAVSRHLAEATGMAARRLTAAVWKGQLSNMASVRSHEDTQAAPISVVARERKSSRSGSLGSFR